MCEFPKDVVIFSTSSIYWDVNIIYFSFMTGQKCMTYLYVYNAVYGYKRRRL